ncbi:hydroxyacid dehydrogenase [Candidimonas nitroreducens]|uniref:Hydroxyacid dehydrogenase n=2 Tax=Candidimonas nitroreducens TaxID=683354 RepID=A0A225MRL2_9BURK|nr:hydroxyacid dehydrogenase [Candidimonas nitroreducens]
MADWSPILETSEVEVFRDHITDHNALVERLLPFDVICVMRERTPLNADVLGQLPNLKVIASTGPRNRSIDADAAARRGISILPTGYFADATVEMTWALILASARRLPQQIESVRSGGWQTDVGSDLKTRTLGVLGLGKIGARVAAIGNAFGMRVIAWSQNLTPEAAAAHGVQWVDKEALLSQSDYLTVHLLLSDRTRGIIGSSELALMKSTAILINTSRGPIVDEKALIEALRHEAIGGAALDVYEVEPLPADHPFRFLRNVLPSPHIGYVSERLYRTFYEDTVRNLRQWLSDQSNGASPNLNAVT